MKKIFIYAKTCTDAGQYVRNEIKAGRGDCFYKNSSRDAGAVGWYYVWLSDVMLGHPDGLLIVLDGAETRNDYDEVIETAREQGFDIEYDYTEEVA